jgi:hypothetical protein
MEMKRERRYRKIYFTFFPPPSFALDLCVLSDGVVAIPAVHGLISPWLERYLGFLATASACHGKHLALWPETKTTATRTLRFPCSTAFRAALGLVSVAFGSEEFLLICGKSEVNTAVSTLDRLVCKTHWMTSCS